MERNSFWKNPWSLFGGSALYRPSALSGIPWFVCFFCCRNGHLTLVTDICVKLFKFLFVVSALTIAVSARSKQAKNALLRLLVFWLFFVVFLPKSAQALGNYYFPTPTKLTFNAAIEQEVIEKGDSHNPNDPYYNQLRDSVLAVHEVTKTADLPFNYSGFIMREGEKISSQLYRKHLKN